MPRLQALKARKAVQRQKNRLARKMVRGTLFLGPAVFLIVLMYCVPIVVNILISFTDMGASVRVTEWTVENYIRLFFVDTRLQQAAILSLLFSFIGVTCSVGLALVLAIATTGIDNTVGTFYRLLWLLPRIAPVVVYALLIKLAVSPTDQALLNKFVIMLGFEAQDWLDMAAFPIVIIACFMIGASLGMIVFTASIRSIPGHLFHAASADGAGRFGQILHVILPALRPQIAFMTAFQLLSFFVTIDVILLITGGGPFYDTTTYPVYTANRAFSTGQYAYGAALSTIMVLIGMALAALVFQLQRGQAVDETPKIEVD